ncbi:MAG: carboxypeptidase-like regulatory domain-containing protein [Bryobacteraceae bacterium]
MSLLRSILLCVISASPGFGQLLLGRISGTVSDPSGGAMARAKVEALNADTNLKLAALTQANGIYQFANLPIGAYKVTIGHEGFQSRQFTSIPVSANRTTTVDAQLALASMNSAVDVSSEAPLVNQSDATIGYVLDSATIQNTPLGTGSFTQLAILSPGVNAEFLAGSGTNSGLGNQNIWANGQRDTSNSFTINSVSGNNLFNGKSSSQVAENRFLLNTGQNSLQHAGGETQTSTSVYDAIGQGMPTPAPETLQELRVNTAQYDASQGGSSGAQIALITRSGTNAYHGQLYEYFQNDALNAAPFFRNADPVISQHDKVPALHYNRFGATFGGPIVKDRLFFFSFVSGRSR